MHGDLQMNGRLAGYRITGLPTNISLIQDDSDAASFSVCNEGLNLKIDKSRDTMTGDLLMSSSNNDNILLGCLDFGNNQKAFSLSLGNINNQLLYNTLQCFDAVGWL